MEDMLLKDTEENRNLQKELMKEADRIQNKNKKKKGDRRLSDRSRLSGDGSEDDIGEGRLMEDPEDGEIQFSILRGNKNKEDIESDRLTEPSTSPHKLNLLDELQNMRTDSLELLEDPEDVNTEVLPLNLPDSLKKKLEQDYHLINNRRKLPKLPSQPNVVNILELFVRNFAIQKLAQLEKQLAKSPYSQFTKVNSEKEAEKYDEVLNHINICKEVAEGVRIIIDFQLGNILLYRKEEEQFAKSSELKPVIDNSSISRLSPVENVTNAGRKHGASESDGGDNASGMTNGKKRTRLSTVSSNKDEAGPGASIGSASSGTMTPTLPHHGLGHNSAYPQSSKSYIILDQLGSWKLVPDTLYLETPVPPSLIYGGIYLARLMVKIPKVIAKMRFSSKNAKKIIKYLFSPNIQITMIDDN